MSEFWRKRLSRCRERFQQLAAQSPVYIKLIEYPRRSSPTIDPNSKVDLMRSDMIYGDWNGDRNRTVRIPAELVQNELLKYAIGSSQFEDGMRFHLDSKRVDVATRRLAEACDEFLKIAGDSAQAIAAAHVALTPEVIPTATMDCGSDDTRWIYALFDVCWHAKLDGLPPLTRYIQYQIIENGKAIPIQTPLDSIELTRQCGLRLGNVELPTPPYTFFAEINNAAEVSVNVIDWLLETPEKVRPISQTAEVVPKRPTNGQIGNEPVRKRGRPKDTDENADKNIFLAWATGHFKTYAQLANSLRIERREAVLAIGRHKKRIERETK